MHTIRYVGRQPGDSPMYSLWQAYRSAIIDYVQSREQTWREECALRMQVASGRLFDAGIPETRLTNYFDLIAAQYAPEAGK